MSSLTILDQTINVVNGLFSLNDLHRASGGDVWLDVSDDDTKTMIASAIRDALYCQDVYFGEDEMPDDEYAQMRDEEYAHYLDECDEEYAQDLAHLDELMEDG